MLGRPEFLDALGRLALLEPATLEELRRQVQEQPVPARVLADRLVEQGVLTGYQAKQVLAGDGAELLLGPYLVLDRLGTGGMGAVYKALHRALGRIDAVKVVRDDILENEEAVKRFAREARAAAQLRHRNVVLVYDAGVTEDDLHYMAMEYVEGTDLGKLVKREGALPVAVACEYVRQAAVGLQHLHERGLVHRDIKPSNLLVQQAGEEQPIIKIVDLGLVRFKDSVVGSRPLPMTELGAMMGTPDFLAPEQATDARSVDIRADLYSLGCTLYYLLAGEVPFPAPTIAEKLVGHQLREPRPLRVNRPDVPENIVAVVARLMAKKPEDRYQTPTEVAEALGVIVENLTKLSASRSVGASRRPAGTETPLLEGASQWRNPRPQRRRWWRPLAAAAIVVALATGGYLAWKGLGAGPGSGAPVASESGGPPPSSTGAVVLPPTSAPPATRPPATDPGHYRNSAGMEFVHLKPGSFDMGSPESEHGRYRDEVRHRVTLTHGFWMQTTLVTQKQWQAILGQANNPSRFRGDDLPVDNVSWDDVKGFCTALAQKENDGRMYRLPYEVEWEYAARAGTTTPFWQGMTITPQDANFDAAQPYRNTEPKAVARDRTTPVKQFGRPNPWGLYDMGGNLWQWCEDGYAAYPKMDVADPKGDEKAAERVLRGGSWGDPALRCRAATRNKALPSARYSNFGFRVVYPAGPGVPGSD
jgi:formylglycine-generating enzyme required for sulfatase activity/tRNA A-37 threonylcarbamoyl transferase component Bud32